MIARLTISKSLKRMSRDKRGRGIPVRSTQLTATVSVALVLVILGLTALLGLAARSVSHDIRQQVGFVVVMADGASESQVLSMRNYWRKAPYVANVRYSSAEEVMARWQELAGDDGSEKALLGVNPFSPEFEVSVTAAYSNPDSLKAVTDAVRRLPGVGDVQLHSDLIKAVNNTMHSLTLVLLIVAVCLLTISFVLINNTVRLTIYSRRFLIHTMKLVGATPGFIRRPFVVSNILQGLIAAAVASTVLGGLLWYLTTVDPEVMRAVGVYGLIAVLAALFVLGAAICGLSALLSANKYLRADYDEMFY